MEGGGERSLEDGIRNLQETIRLSKAFSKRGAKLLAELRRKKKKKNGEKKRYRGEFENLDCLSDCVDVAGKKYLYQFVEIFEDEEE